MKRVFPTVVLLALVVPSAASAHGAYSYLMPKQANRLEVRMDEYRLAHGHTILLPSLMTHVANSALATANFMERKWTTRIAGEPYRVWSTTIYGTTRASAIIKTIRCYGRPYTASQALRNLRNASSYYRAVMLWDGWMFGSARAVRMHAHSGWFKGKGECRAFYFSFSN